MQFKISLKFEILATLLLLIVFFSFNFYFFDAKSYPIGRAIRLFVTYFGVFVLLLIERKLKLTIPAFLYFIYLLVWNYGAYIVDSSYNNYFLFGINTLIFMLIISNHKYYKTLRKVFDIHVKLFIIIAIPAVFISLLLLIGVDLPFKYIDLGGRGIYEYRNYFGVAILRNLVIENIGFGLFTRLSGLFEEPGMLGTYLGIMFIFDTILFQEKKKRKYVMAVMGLLTFSLAFFIFLILILIFYFRKRFFQYSLLIIIVSLLIYAILPKNLKLVVNERVVDRFGIEYNKKWDMWVFSGDTRFIDHVKFKRYSKFRVQDFALVVGAGNNSNSKLPKEHKFASFYKIIYESGFFGFILILSILFWYLLFIPIKYKKFSYLILTLGPILSVYQGRQEISIIIVFYMILFKFYLQNEQIKEE